MRIVSVVLQEDWNSPCCKCPCPCGFFNARTHRDELIRGCIPCGCTCGYIFSSQHKRITCKLCYCDCGTCIYALLNTPICCQCSCFPSTARVSLENGRSVTMDQLQIGDRIRTGKKSVTLSVGTHGCPRVVSVRF